MIRSKNAGPFVLTIDVMMSNSGDYQKVLQSKVLDRTVIARIYHVDETDVGIYEHPSTHSLKVTLARPAPSGSFHDTDLYGAQLYVPLLDLEMPADAR